MMYRAFISSLFAFAFLSVASAQEFSAGRESDAGRYAECAAYYELAMHSLNASGATDVAAIYYALQQEANLYSLLLAKQGRTNHLATKVTNSRIEMYLQKMRQETHNRNENISILINKYHIECSDLIEKPTAEIRRLLSESPVR